MKAVNNYLYKHYYFNNDGTPDEIADSLGDCIIQCAYVILKNKYIEEIPIPIKLIVLKFSDFFNIGCKKYI